MINSFTMRAQCWSQISLQTDVALLLRAGDYILVTGTRSKAVHLARE